MKLLHRSRTVAVLLTAGLALLAWTGPTVPAMADSLNPPTTHDTDVLISELDTLAAQGRAGQAQFWYVDTTAMKVNVYILASATDPVTAAFRAVATARPELAVVELIDTAIEPLVGHDGLDVGATNQQPRANTIYGGEKISLGGGYCTSGFNGTVSGTGPVVVTAGHCAKVGRNGWYANGALLGNITDFRYPGKDWSVIKPVAGWSQPNAVKTSNGGIQQISAFANPSLNEPVCKTGATTGTTCGTVTALNVTANYGDGPVYGLARTTVYSQPGDSGGSVYDKSTGVAMISGGTKDGKTVFVQPIQSL